MAAGAICALRRARRAERAHRSLALARSSYEVVEAILGYAAWMGRRGALFLALRQELRGWAGRGPGITGQRLSQARLRLAEPSVLAYLATTPASYRGTIRHDIRSRSFLIDALGSLPEEITAFSITAPGRILGVCYADGIAASVRGAELLQLGREAGRSLARARAREQPGSAGSSPFGASPNRDAWISH